MTRDEFVSQFRLLITDHADHWLPEESTTDEMLNILLLRLNEHKKSIIGGMKDD